MAARRSPLLTLALAHALFVGCDAYALSPAAASGGVKGALAASRPRAEHALCCAADADSDNQDVALATKPVSREEMSTRGRSSAEVAVGLNTADWKREVAAARSRGVTAVRVRHILVDSDEIAAELRAMLRSGDARFEDLATATSACAASRDKGGEVGWSGVNDEHLDEILPRNIRERAIGCQPGDVFVERSSLGKHVVQVEDVFQTLSITSEPRTRGLPGSGIKPRPLIELLRASRDDDRGLKQVAAQHEGQGLVLATSAADEEQEAGGSLAKNSGKTKGARTMLYSMDSMGCQMNSADAERMEGQLKALGFAQADEPKDAQVVVINTCSIREHAQAKVYSYLGPHAQRKQRGEDLAIVVAGCVAQQEGEELLRRVPEIDLVMGPQYANRLGDLLEGVFNGNQIVATAPTHIMEDPTQPQRQSETCAWVNIIYGCNERCSYCVVPTTRGAEQSRPRDAIRAEIEELLAKG